jgi:hypothetical protein
VLLVVGDDKLFYLVYISGGMEEKLHSFCSGQPQPWPATVMENSLWWKNWNEGASPPPPGITRRNPARHATRIIFNLFYTKK